MAALSLDASLQCAIDEAVAGDRLDSFVHYLFDQDLLQPLLITRVVDAITHECLDLCRRSQPSMFRHSHPTDYVNFQWSQYVADFSNIATALQGNCESW